MIQTVAWGGDYPHKIAQNVNEWIADRANSRYQILDIQYRYGDYAGAMIIYEDDPHDNEVNIVQLPKFRS